MEDLRNTRSRAAYRRAQSWGTKDLAALPGLPVLIRTQGLLTALALTRKSAALLSETLIHWLRKDWIATPLPSSEDGVDHRSFVDAFVRLDARAAAAVEWEALQYAETMKIVADVIKPEGSDGQ